MGERKLISFGLLVSDASGFYKQTSGRTNTNKSITMQRFYFTIQGKRITLQGLMINIQDVSQIP